MKAYELLFFVDPSLDPETRLAVMKRIDTTIAEGAGKVDSVDEWGKRKLAYEINDLTDGDYTLINFHADPTQIAELDRDLTRDPELRATAGGTQVLSFGVAVNDRRRNPQTGEWEDYPNFVDCTMFGTRAEAVSRFLAKGNKVAIEGKLRYSSWERDGQRRSKLEVIVDEIEFMSSRGGQGGYDQGGYAPAAPAAPAPRPAAPVATPPAVDVYDEDIPF